MDGKVTRGNFLKGKTAKRILAIGFLALTCIAVLGGTAFAAFSRGSVMLQPAAIGAQAVLSGAEEVQVSEMLAASHPFSVINLRTSGNYSQPGQRFSLPIGRGLTLPNGSDAPDGDAPIMLLLDAGASLLGSAESADETGAVDEVNTEEVGIVDEVNAEGVDALTESNTEKAEAVIEAIAEKFAEEELAEAVDEAESELFVMALDAEPAESDDEAPTNSERRFTVTQTCSGSLPEGVQPGIYTIYCSNGEIAPCNPGNNRALTSDIGVVSGTVTMDISSIHIVPYDGFYINSVAFGLYDESGERIDADGFSYNNSDNGADDWYYLYLNGSNGYSIPEGTELRIDIKYFSWGRYTLSQSYSDPNYPEPSSFGATLNTTYGDMFIPDGGSGKVGEVQIFGNTAQCSGRADPNKYFNFVSAAPPAGYVISSIHAYDENGEMIDDAFFDFSRYNTISATGYWQIWCKYDYRLTPGKELKIVVEYAPWGRYSVTQRYADTEDAGLTSYGTVHMKSTAGSVGNEVFLPDGDSNWVNDIFLQPNETQCGGTIMPGKRIDVIYITPPAGCSVTSIHAYDENDAPVDTFFDFSSGYTSMPASGNWEVWCNYSYTVPAGKELNIVVEYAPGGRYSVTQRYTDPEDAGLTEYGTVLLHSTSGNEVFLPDTGSSWVQDVCLQPNETQCSGTFMPEKYISVIYITPPVGRSVASVHAYDEKGNNIDGDLFDSSNMFNRMPASGDWDVWCNYDYTVPAGKEVNIVVEYHNWGRYEMAQSFAENTTKPDPLVYGTIYLQSDTKFIPDGETEEMNGDTLGSSETECGGISQLQYNVDDYSGSLLYATVTPPTGYAIVSLCAYDGEHNDITDSVIASIEKNHLNNETDMSTWWYVTFRNDFVIHPHETMRLEAVYGLWGSYELKQSYSAKVENPPATFGSVELNGSTSFFPGGDITAENAKSSVVLSINEEQCDGIVKSEGQQLRFINVAPPCCFDSTASYSVASVTAYDEDGNTTEDILDFESSDTSLDKTENWLIYFRDGYTVPLDGKLHISVEYGNWGRYEITQGYSSSVENPPSELGIVLLRGGYGHLPDGETEVVSNIYVTEAEATGIARPDRHFYMIEATPPTNYSVTAVRAYLKNNETVSLADYENNFTRRTSKDSWVIQLRCDEGTNVGLYVPVDDILRIEVEYGEWGEYSIKKLHATDSGDPQPMIEGTVEIKTGYGLEPTEALQAAPDAALNSGETECRGLILPETNFRRIVATPPEGHYVSAIKVYRNGVEDPDALNFDFSGNNISPSGVWNVYFANGYDLATKESLDVEVFFDDYKEYTLSQRYVIDPKPDTLGTVTLQGYGIDLLPNDTTEWRSYDSLLPTESRSGGVIKPGMTLTQINITPLTNYNVSSVKVLIDGVEDTDALDMDYQFTSTPAFGSWLVYFRNGYTMPAGKDLEIVVEYDGYSSITVTQMYAEGSAVPSPLLYGTVNVQNSSYGFVHTAGSDNGYGFTLSELQTERKSFIKPDTALTFVTAAPPVGYAVKDIAVKLNGTPVAASAFDTASSAMPVGGTWELRFADSFAVPEDTDVEIIVTYAQLRTVTLAQENLVQGGLGTVTLTADGEGFAATDGTTATFTGTTASDSRSIVSGTALSGLTVTPPSGLTVLSATSNLLVGGADAVTLNADGTVSIAPVVPDKDVTIEIKYGSRMYVKSNQAGVVMVDSTAATTDFAKLCDLVAPTKTVSITALNGWVIKSVKYGTDSGSQSTPVTAIGDSYEITSIASDIYLDVEVERDSRRLSAKLDGEGGASFVYGGVTTTLTDVFKVIDSDIQIDSTVSFETIADANSEITDVTLNGVSLGNTRSFTMPESDSVIVVHTKLKEFDIKAVLTGDGEAQAVYGGTTTTLDANAKVVAADVVTGDYDITFAPLEGSEILSVSVDGTPITPNTDNVYSVAVTADDVLVTVETRKIPEYTINAKASVAGAAKANGTDLTTDYSEIMTALEGKDATLTFAIDPQYTLVEVKCGDTPDALAAITLTDSAYSFEELASDKYVEVVLEELTKPMITVNRTGDGVIYTNGGSADVSNTSYSVDSGSDHSFDFIPLDGAQLLKVTVKIGDNTPVTVYDPANSVNVPVLKKALNTAGKSSHSIEDITENVTVNAEFTTLPEYKIHLIKEGEGEGTFEFDGTSYTASFDADVTHGSTPSITIKAKKGSKLESVKVGDSAENAVKVELTDSVLTLPEISGDVYVVVSLKKVEPSSGIPTTGDDGTGVILTAVAANLFILSGLACTAIMQKRRRDRKQQEA